MIPRRVPSIAGNSRIAKTANPAAIDQIHDCQANSTFKKSDSLTLRYAGSRPSDATKPTASIGATKAGTPAISTLSIAYERITCNTVMPLLRNIDVSVDRRRAMIPATMNR